METLGGDDMPKDSDRELPHDGDAVEARARSGAITSYPVAPVVITVSPVALTKVLEACENPPEPSQALRDFMAQGRTPIAGE
jgi:hypothetical protein